MAIDERARHRLYLKLEAVLGPEDASVLMEHLPPVGWADVATKQDVEHLKGIMDARFEGMDHRLEAMEHRILATMRKEMVGQTTTMVRTMILGNAAAVLAVAGIAFGAARLT